MKKHLQIVFVLFLFQASVNSQDLNKCKIDFFLLESQKESLGPRDEGKEFLINIHKFPNYSMIGSPSKSKEELQRELAEKLKDNQDYNKNNSTLRDSLIDYYSSQINKTGVTLIWWEKKRQINESEQKEYKKRIREYDRKASFGFYDLPNRGGRAYGKNWDPSIPRPEYINDSTLIVKNNEIWVREIKIVPANVPLFWIQDKDSSLKVTYNNEKYFLPVGVQPFFDPYRFQNSSLILRNESGSAFSNIWTKFSFIVDNKYKLSIDNYLFLGGIDKSREIFYDKKKLQKVNEFLETLKSKRLIIEYQNEIIKYPKILKSIFDYNTQTLAINIEINGEEKNLVFEGKKDMNSVLKITFDLPIYDQDCYNQKILEFNNIKLNSDYFNNPALKKTLLSALESSPEWMNFKIGKVILTNKSQWTIVINKYTGLKESRFMFADVYFTSTIDNKCYFQKDVYFNQKADPIDGFIYSIFVSVPQSFQQYPCNLK